MKMQSMKTFRSPGAQSRDPFYRRIAKDIDCYGWRLMGVLDDEDHLPFIYTIGNCECGCPSF